MPKIEKILKKQEDGTKKTIYPATICQAIRDGKTGASLETLLSQFNSIYVQYNGTAFDTRNLIPESMRRAGLIITYMNMDSETISERAVSAVQADNDHWGLDVNWTRIDQFTLSGRITISSEGTWLVDGEDTGIKAVGPKGDAGLTPWLKTIDNKLHFSYDNVTWEPCSENIATWFRWNDNKIQISRDNKTWTDFSGKFADNVYIKGYVANYASLPTGAAQGDIYGVGPTYAAEDTAHTNPIYRYYVRNANSWVDNGQFTSISAGVVQETGNSETEVMSQKAVTDKLSELGSKVGELPLVWVQGTIEDGTSGIPAGSVNNVGHSRICSSAKLPVGCEIIYNVIEGYNLAISDWDGLSSTITHKSGWVNGCGKWLVENENVFFIVSKGGKVEDVNPSEGFLIDLYTSDSLFSIVKSLFQQKSLTDSVDADNAVNGVMSFVSSSTPIGLPNLNYGNGAVIITNRISDKKLSSWDRQYLITMDSIANRVYYNGSWGSWSVKSLGGLSYNKYSVFATNASNVLDDLNNALIDVIYKMVIVDGYVPNNLPSDYPLSGVDAWLESKKTYYLGNSYTINQRINFDSLHYYYTREFNSDGGVWSTWIKRYYANTDENRTVTIGVNGQYKTLREGLAYACSLNSAKVIVNEGVYDLAEEFTDMISNPIEGNMGIELKNDVHVIFNPGAYVKAILPLDNTLRTYFNPFFMTGSFTLEGLNIEVANTRYCVHDEGASRAKVKTSYKNCTMKNHSDIYVDATGEHCFYQCIGGGMGLHHEVEIQNCYFESMKGDSSDVASVSYHNGYSERCDGKIFVSNSYFAFNNTFSVQHYGNSTIKTRAFVNNCSLGKPLITKAETVDSTIVNMEILEFNNTVRE